MKNRRIVFALLLLLLIGGLVLLVSLLGGSNEEEPSPSNEAAASEGSSTSQRDHPSNNRSSRQSAEASAKEDFASRIEKPEDVAPPGLITALLRIRFSDEIEKQIANLDRAEIIRSLQPRLVFFNGMRLPDYPYGGFRPELPANSAAPLKFRFSASFEYGKRKWMLSTQVGDSIDLPKPKKLEETLIDFGEVVVPFAKNQKLIFVTGKLVSSKGIPLAKVEGIELRIYKYFYREGASGGWYGTGGEVQLPPLDSKGEFLTLLLLDVENTSWEEIAESVSIYVCNSNTNDEGKIDMDPSFPERSLTKVSEGLYSVGTVALPGAILEVHPPESLPAPFEFIAGERSSPYQINPFANFYLILGSDWLGCSAPHPHSTLKSTTLLVDSFNQLSSAEYSWKSLRGSIFLREESIDLDLAEGEFNAHTLKLNEPEYLTISVLADGVPLQRAKIRYWDITPEERATVDFANNFRHFNTGMAKWDREFTEKRPGKELPYVVRRAVSESSPNVIYSWNDEYQPVHVIVTDPKQEVVIELTERWPEEEAQFFKVILHAEEEIAKRMVSDTAELASARWGGDPVDLQTSKIPVMLRFINEKGNTRYQWAHFDDGKAEMDLELEEGSYTFEVVCEKGPQFGYYRDVVLTIKDVVVSYPQDTPLEITVPSPPSTLNLMGNPIRFTCGGLSIFFWGNAQGKFGPLMISEPRISGFPLEIADPQGAIEIMAIEKEGALSFEAELPERVVVSFKTLPTVLEGLPFQIVLQSRDYRSDPSGNIDRAYTTRVSSELGARAYYSLWGVGKGTLSLWNDGLDKPLRLKAVGDINLRDFPINRTATRIEFEFEEADTQWLRIDKDDSWKKRDSRYRDFLEWSVRWSLFSSQNGVEERVEQSEFEDDAWVLQMEAGDYRLVATYNEATLFQRRFRIQEGKDLRFSVPAPDLPKLYQPVLILDKAIEPQDEEVWYYSTNPDLRNIGNSYASENPATMNASAPTRLKLDPVPLGSRQLVWSVAEDNKGSLWMLGPQLVNVQSPKKLIFPSEWRRAARFELPDGGFNDLLLIAGDGWWLNVEAMDVPYLPESNVTLQVYDYEGTTRKWSRSFFVTPDANGRWRIPEDAIAELRQKGLLRE